MAQRDLDRRFCFADHGERAQQISLIDFSTDRTLMRITKLEAIPVRVPLKAGMVTKTAHGDHHTSDYVIVRLYTDDGLVGLGEATVSALWSGETSKSCVAALTDLIGPALLGADPTQLTMLRKLMDFLIKVNPFTKAAVEMALWDIAGKARGVPVYQFLGGKTRDVIPTKMMIGAFDLPHVRALAEQFLSWGVRCLKVKVGLDLAGDLARVTAVRDVAGPDIPITIDANCGWNATTARIALDQLRPLQILVAEQPIAPGDAEAMASLRSAGIPIMVDESVFTLADAWNVLRAHAADVVSIYPGKNGGIAAAVEIAHVALAAGVPCHVGSNLELGIGSAAMLHLACAVSNVDSESYPADILGPHYHETDLLSQPLKLDPGGAKVPDSPGLGVCLDEDKLNHYRVN
jgi:L-alanine-DL-glutamate epimerase-like enolase superfamily enzyme